MNAWLVDLTKEVVVALLVSGFTWLGHFASKLGRDLDAAFKKIRDLDQRVRDLERQPCREE